MKETSSKDLHKALAMRLAHRDISDAVIAKITDRLKFPGGHIGGLDFCPYGICIDYFTFERPEIDTLLRERILRSVKVFPIGILVDDLWRVQFQMHVPEIAETQVR